MDESLSAIGLESTTKIQSPIHDLDTSSMDQIKPTKAAVFNNSSSQSAENTNDNDNLLIDEDAHDTDEEDMKKEEEEKRRKELTPPPAVFQQPSLATTTETENENYETSIHPKLKKILKIYRSESHKSILGPHVQTAEQLPQPLLVQPPPLPKSHHHEYDFDNWSAPPPNSLIKYNSDALHQSTASPTLLTSPASAQQASANNNNNSKCEAYLHGERITCFIVGGEKRLCLPEMLNYVLKDFTVQQINNVCEKLHIYCSRCTNSQLETLKTSRLLPMSAPSCGLISLSDAERLCHILLNNNLGKIKKLNDTTNLNNSITSSPQTTQQNSSILKVYHRCFGRTYGIIHTQLYTNPNSQCIECDTCHLMYAPMNFVVHTHKHDETRICHWGFNSSNWRLYLQLVNSYKENEKYKLEFEQFKNKFSTNKRKSLFDEEEPQQQQQQQQQPADDECCGNSYINQKIMATLYDHHQQQQQHQQQQLPYAAAVAKKFCKYVDEQQQHHQHQQQQLQNKSVVGCGDESQVDYLLDTIRNEIDLNVKSINIKERLIQYVQQLHDSYDDKVHKSVNKSRSDLNDTRQGLQTENENLKNRLKVVEIENQILRNELTKIQHQLTIYNAGLTAHAQQQHHLQQHHRTSSAATYLSDILNDTNCSNSTGNDQSNTTTMSSSSTSPQQQAAAIALISLNNSPTSSSSSPSSLISPISAMKSFRKPSPFSNVSHPHQLKINRLLQQQQHLQST